MMTIPSQLKTQITYELYEQKIFSTEVHYHYKNTRSTLSSTNQILLEKLLRLIMKSEDEYLKRSDIAV